MSDPDDSAPSKFVQNWSEHPVRDLIAPAILAILFWFLSARFDLAEAAGASVRSALYTGLAELAGIAFAASVFICTMVYQSTNYLMSNIRRTHSIAIRRNWLVIMASQIGAAVVALVAHLIDTLSPDIALSLVIGSLALVVALTVRSLWWLAKTLFIEDVASKSEKVRGYDAELLTRKH